MKNSDWRECVDVVDFSYEEMLLLSAHFGFYWALYNDERPAKTTAQRQFVENCYNGVPSNEHEEVFYKFLEKTGNVEAFPDEAESLKGELENDFHAVRGPASVDDILGGANGKPPPVLDTDVPLDGFGDRGAWDRMRGRRKR